LARTEGVYRDDTDQTDPTYGNDEDTELALGDHKG
jgi:hypothetical protein